MDFWRIFENFDFAVLVLDLPAFRVFCDISNLTFPSSLAAVSTFNRAQKPGPILVTEDIMGLQKSGHWSHGSRWPWQELVHKIEPTVFWDRGSVIFCAISFPLTLQFVNLFNE